GPDQCDDPEPGHLQPRQLVARSRAADGPERLRRDPGGRSVPAPARRADRSRHRCARGRQEPRHEYRARLGDHDRAGDQRHRRCGAVGRDPGDGNPPDPPRAGDRQGWPADRHHRAGRHRVDRQRPQDRQRGRRSLAPGHPAL
ncbi:MAG: CBS domain protein, partial [uncultured Lysobacter sp.]